VPKSSAHFSAWPGTLSPRGFMLAAIVVYIAGVASHMLTAPAIIGPAGLWPFILTQVLLIWIWFAIHASRLRDAGRGVGLAIGVAAIYGLAVALLLIVAVAFLGPPAASAGNANNASVVSLLLIVTVFSILLGGSDYAVVWAVVAVLTVIVVVPPTIALGFSVWAATLPRVGPQPG